MQTSLGKDSSELSSVDRNFDNVAEQRVGASSISNSSGSIFGISSGRKTDANSDTSRSKPTQVNGDAEQSILSTSTPILSFETFVSSALLTCMESTIQVPRRKHEADSTLCLTEVERAVEEKAENQRTSGSLHASIMSGLSLNPSFPANRIALRARKGSSRNVFLGSRGVLMIPSLRSLSPFQFNIKMNRIIKLADSRLDWLLLKYKLNTVPEPVRSSTTPSLIL